MFENDVNIPIKATSIAAERRLAVVLAAVHCEDLVEESKTMRFNR
jgi:hypothetical protein